jgi:NAD(P)-dependent dehydrogenase (short-subunit alcohol dehydrogenase family)
MTDRNVRDGEMGACGYRYEGKRALVVGGASGMGAAVAERVRLLGGEVVVMDVTRSERDGESSVPVDLRDERTIDLALQACGGPIHALFACAGVADGTEGIERVNFIGHRHLIEKAIAEGLLTRGAAIGLISSTAGLGWEHDTRLRDYLNTPDFHSAVAWIDSHPGTATYMWSKRAICGYVARQAFSLLQRGVRINAILPGPTDTPLAQANADQWLAFGSDYRAATEISPSTPAEQAWVLAFLCSDAASVVTGQTVMTDAGYISSGITGSFPPAAPVVEFLAGRGR